MRCSGRLIDESGNGTQGFPPLIDHKTEVLARKLAVLAARASVYEVKFIFVRFTAIVVPLYVRATDT
jgi:hypothetical protein